MAIRIIPARIEDAPLIGKAITIAIGDELVEDLAGEMHTPEDVLELFTSLARRSDSQYSYLNTLVALDKEDNNKVAGLIVSYDGARLYTLRHAFFKEASEKIGMEIEGFIPDSTDSKDSGLRGSDSTISNSNADDLEKTYDLIPKEYDETSADEYYLDSLAVFPEYRGRGIARELIKAAVERAKEAGKPAGLLVSKHNPKARELYESLGFKPIGERFFAGELMTHMSLSK